MEQIIHSGDAQSAALAAAVVISNAVDVVHEKRN
jgi:hypothetical protein